MMSKVKYTITNDFHGTAYSCVTDMGYMSARQIRRCRAALCANPTCTCGGNLREHGPQTCDIEYHGRHDIRLTPKWEDLYNRLEAARIK